MKTSFLKPGFEFIFALSLLAILGLPPMLMAQNQKDMDISIVNGDTTINGTNIKNLSAKDKQNALKDIKHLSADAATDNTPAYHFNKTDSVVTGHPGNGDRRLMKGTIIITKDSLGNVVETRTTRHNGQLNKMTYKYAMPERMDRNGNEDMGGPMPRGNRRNSQNFTYVNTDINDISTRVTFHVSDVTNEDLRKMPHVEGARLEINDLNIVPQFSTGKTLLLFNLPSKGVAEIKLVDSEGKILWTEKAQSGMFTKSFALGLNGIYYLQVKQGDGVAVKRILKEQ